MNDTNEFDKIARRKLAERTFAFEEAQWAIVERSLASKGRSRRGIVFFAIAALFIGTGVIWWGASRTGDTVVAERASDKSSPVAQEPGNGTSRTVGNERTSPAETSEATTVGGAAASEELAGKPELKDNTVAADKRSADAGPIVTRQHGPGVIPHNAEAVAGAGVQSDVAIEIHDANQHANETANGDGVIPTDGASNMISGTTIALVAETPLTTDPIAQAGATGNGEASGQVTSASPVDEAGVTGSVPTPPTEGTKDLLPVAQTGEDSIGATPTPPIPSEVPGPLGRWELSLLAGGFSTLNHYSWNGDTDPGMEVQRAPSAGYGAELMKMGAHFGWGSGLHYSSYAEQIDAGELSNTEQVESTNYYLMPVDTTILVIIDTIMLGGTIHYVTGQLDTTFNVLASQTVTNTLTHQQREARELVNRVSYLEIPVLFDAHMRSGHWNFGVRGGPTIGFLTSSRGSLPNAALDGYVDLRPEQLRSTVFGYMARVYVHFALTDAWAIGIEPTAKGQLTSTLLEGDVVRKSSALGAFFSVTHRLR